MAIAISGTAVCSAAEPIAVAGTIYHPSSFTNSIYYALRSHETDQPVAALADPRRLIAQPGGAVLQTESRGTRYAGLPLLEVLEVFPETWAQALYRGHYAKGFGAYSGENSDLQSRDYALAPYSFDRAYDRDMGQALSSVDSLTAATSTLKIPPLVFSRDSIQIRWPAEPGMRYDLLYSQNITGPFERVAEVILETDQDASVNLPINRSGTGFYKLQLNSTLTP